MECGSLAVSRRTGTRYDGEAGEVSARASSSDAAGPRPALAWDTRTALPASGRSWHIPLLEDDLVDRAAEDSPRAHARRRTASARVGLRRIERDEDVQRIRVVRLPEIGRRRPCRGCDVRVDDPPDDLAGIVDRDREPEQLLRIDLVPEWRGEDVPRGQPSQRLAALGRRAVADDQP